MPARNAHGYPMKHSDARLMDVIARLSGVNFGSVEKVFAALDMVRRIRGSEWDKCGLLPNAPAIPAHADPAKRDYRMRATERELSYLLRNQHMVAREACAILMLDARFNSDGSGRKADRSGGSGEAPNGTLSG